MTTATANGATAQAASVRWRQREEVNDVSEPGSVGIVETRYFTFAEPPDQMPLESGQKLGPITLAYETYGELNAERDNAILVCHALSGDAHVAGFHAPEDKAPGWWDVMVGPGKAFDTDEYFVICANIIGGCKGSTGPASINPATGRPYALSFPVVTVKDMVDAQKRLIDHLGIERLYAVVGGSMGGMQALEWAVSYPDGVRLVLPIATTSKLSPQAIAFNEVGRQAITADPDWMAGEYYGKTIPFRGLSIARMIGHITYLSDESMHRKFGRRLQDRAEYGYDFVTDFQVESYLHHKGDSFVNRFDANSYLYITKAMDYFDLGRAHGSLEAAFAKTKARFLVASFSSDWLFPPYQSREIVSALRKSNIEVVYAEIQTGYGHDAFLLEAEELTKLVSGFLKHGRDEQHRS
jgi:homoserine O-acetyltransferase